VDLPLRDIRLGVYDGRGVQLVRENFVELTQIKLN
jgi:hypothetical protein